jgi:diguanylate cyclase (GGDEF)-like protein/PAS domain S-box-containing protein
MDPLYILTVILSYVVINAICAIVIFLLWRRIHNRFSGSGLWLAGYLTQFTGIALVLMRNILPGSIAVILGNGLLITSAILVYIGLEKFVGKSGPQWQNAFLLMGFLAIHAFFFFISPSLTARNINISLALIAVCGQSAWLLFRRVDPDMRPITQGPGLILAGYCLTSLVRIAADLVVPSGNDFFRSTNFDTLVLVAYQMLFIALTFTLSLMVNLRLFRDLERDIAIRRKVEEALRESEEKFSKAFHSSPEAILISHARDGYLLEVNDSFCRLSGYSREEALSNSSIPHSLWANPQDEEECFALLQKDHRVRNLEYDFRTKSGGLLHCLYSGEIIHLAGDAYILSVVSDITGRKQAEEVLRRSEANFRGIFENSPEGLFIIDVLDKGKFRIRESNRTQEKISGISQRLLDGKFLEEVFPADTAQAMRASCLRCVEQGMPISMEEGLDLPAGRKYVHTTLAPVRDDAGRIYRIIGSTLDISERKWAEETLRMRLNLWEYAAQHTVDELMQKALDEIEGITGSPISFYHFVMEDEASLSLQAWSTRTQREFCQAEGRGMHYNLDQAGVWADCIRERKPIIHNDYESLPNRKGMPEGHATVVRELVVPTFHGGRMVSVLGIGNKPSPYDEQDAELLSSIADIVWVIVDHKRTEEEIHQLQAQLEQMAVHDSLTGLYNRYYLDVTLKRELARAAREKYPVSFIMIDIDRFKRVNDTFGHKAGDAVLQSLASLLLENSRASDIIFRIGGEEFLAVLPKVKVDLALQIAEKWRKNFLDSTLLLGYGGVKATISCGVAAFPRHGTTGTDLIASADEALYQAKAAGRNQSAIWKHVNPKPKPSAEVKIPKS